ncbi:hypothetical protein ACSLO9_32490, partial [Escherichia coli]
SMVFSYGNAGSGENLLFPVSGVGQLSNAKASATMLRGMALPAGRTPGCPAGSQGGLAGSR